MPDMISPLRQRRVLNLHIIFRGTNGLFALADWGINFLAIPVVGKIVHRGRVLLEGNMHLGFQWRAQAIVTRIIDQLDSILDEVGSILDEVGRPANAGLRTFVRITVCGHSQGAALSTLVAICLATYYGDSLCDAIQLETYANPGAFFSYGGVTCALRCCPGLTTWWAPCLNPWCTYCQANPSSPCPILDGYPIRHVNHDIDIDAVPRAARAASLVNTAHETNTYAFGALYDDSRRASVLIPFFAAHSPENYQTLAHKIVASSDSFRTVTRFRRLLVPGGGQI